MVVHNGIIENYLALKKRLIKEGHQLCDRNRHRNLGASDRKILRRAIWKRRYKRLLKKCEASTLASILTADEPNKIIGVRNGPPSSSASATSEFFVASDIPAILQYTRDIMFLDNHEMAIITDKECVIRDFDG